MAFNFNWSPLTADATFYERARALLTTALNKAPKPPIIEDDILVSELNLGSIPPELEILEVGDLAEDRFQGTFKMSYTGDAFLTLKTRVQANPLHTYLSTRPSWTSPRPVAAATGLTIPIRISLSSIKLSATVILSFSKQKGLTLAFQNDPLESLDVSSSFDSIPFIRDYLQRQIEGQLRNVLMEDVPAIMHKLSLRLWAPDAKPRDDQFSDAEEGDELDEASADEEIILNNFDVRSLQTFSQKSLLCMAVLADSQRTQSLPTPIIPDAIQKVWNISNEPPKGSVQPSPFLLGRPALTRMYSHQPQLSTTSFTTASTMSTCSSVTDKASGPSPGVRTPITFQPGIEIQTPRRRKKKHRIVNLRRSKSSADIEGGADDAVAVDDTASTAPNSISAESSSGGGRGLGVPLTPPSSLPKPDEIEPGDMSIRFERPRSGKRDEVGFGEEAASPYATMRASRRPRRISLPKRDLEGMGISQADYGLESTVRYTPAEVLPRSSEESGGRKHRHSHRHRHHHHHSHQPGSPRPELGRSTSLLDVQYPSIPEAELRLGGLAERAWLMKMADEFSRRAEVQKQEDSKELGAGSRRRVEKLGSASIDGFDGEIDPPPAYAPAVL